MVAFPIGVELPIGDSTYRSCKLIGFLLIASWGTKKFGSCRVGRALVASQRVSSVSVLVAYEVRPLHIGVLSIGG